MPTHKHYVTKRLAVNHMRQFQAMAMRLNRLRDGGIATQIDCDEELHEVEKAFRRAIIKIRNRFSI